MPTRPARSDAEALHGLGYAQELARRMSGLSNFALTFSVIGLLLGLTANFQAGFSVVGAAVGVNWLLGGLFALLVAAALGQIASAYPTAGGLYHWSSILGGRGWGWATAWLNLISYVFSLASVNVAFYNLVIATALTPSGVDASAWGSEHQIPAVIAVTATQAVLNSVGVRLLSRLSDLGAWLNLLGCVLLFGLLLVGLRSFDPSALFTFTNYSGDAGGGVVPRSDDRLLLFGMAMILPLWIMTSFDASAHSSEETVDPQRSVPRAMVASVLISWIVGLVIAALFVLAMPDRAAAAKAGTNIFGVILEGLPVPGPLKGAVGLCVLATTYLCGLCILTGCSRAMFAFARDGGLPSSLRAVSTATRTPVNAIWASAVMAVLATLYSPAFAALSAGTAMFYYVSYAMPVMAGALALRSGWSRSGPFTLGPFFVPAAVVVVVGAAALVFIGLQPPNDVLRVYAVAIVVLLLVGWFGIERRRFPGPPTGGLDVARRAEIARKERAVGETSVTGV